MKWADLLQVEIEWKLELGSFVIRAFDGQQREIPSGILRKQLFAWHETSFYGSLVTEVLQERKLVLALPALLAIDYFSQPRPMLHLSINWPKEMEALQQQSEVVQLILANGEFEPVLSLESNEGFAWRAVSNDADSHINEWLNAAIRQLLEEPGEIRDVWAKLVQNKPLLAMGKRANQEYAGDEDRWLETIGFSQDEIPFSIALRFLEPEVGGSAVWKLIPVYVDRQSSQVYLQHEIPMEWSEFVDERYTRAVTMWRNVWPAYREVLDDEAAWQFIETEAMRLRAAGVTVQMPGWWENLLTKQPRLIADVRVQEASGLFGMQQLLEYDWRIAIGDTEMSESQFRGLLKAGNKLTRVDGQWIALQPKWVKSLQAAMKKHAEHGQHMALSEVLSLHLADGRELMSNAEDLAPGSNHSLKLEVRIQKQLQQWTMQILNHAATEPFEASSNFTGQLRAYQAEGASWLGLLRKSGLGACLADDMGLGKTIQFIAHICQLKASGELNHPVLLICPTSVLGNWQQEWKRFAPDIRTYLHYGSNRKSGEAFHSEINDIDVVITSYSLALLDSEYLSARTWSTVCLDEAQNIKNPAGKQSQVIRTFKSEHRIALTGTPIENRLLELWSIFDFLNPGYLGSMRAFHRSFVKPIERNRDDDVLQKLQRLVRPFLLRRTKRDEHIQLALPDKFEREIYVSLTAEQAALYEQQLDRLLNNIEQLSAMERRGQILSVLTKLKQICNHPGLIDQDMIQKDEEDWLKQSNKLSRLIAMVDEVLAEKQRCIIFTQYVRMGRMIEAILKQRIGKGVAFLHGGVSKDERDRLVAKFQTEPGKGTDALDVFILSLKAGGTGLNLTAATHVFHFDRWWNPAVENQATDRAYRIGQTKQVQVHKFISLGTLEERIHEMIERKQALSENIVGAGESWITEMSTDEIKQLFRLRRDWLVEEET